LASDRHTDSQTEIESISFVPGPSDPRGVVSFVSHESRPAFQMQLGQNFGKYT
jgi:hypothetical protein